MILELHSMVSRRLLTGDVARNPGKKFHFRTDQMEPVKHLKLTKKPQSGKACDTFLRNNMWHPLQNKWLPTYRLAPFDDRVFISAVSEISVIKRNK